MRNSNQNDKNKLLDERSGVFWSFTIEGGEGSGVGLSSFTGSTGTDGTMEGGGFKTGREGFGESPLEFDNRFGATRAITGEFD